MRNISTPLLLLFVVGLVLAFSVLFLAGRAFLPGGISSVVSQTEEKLPVYGKIAYVNTETASVWLVLPDGSDPVETPIKGSLQRYLSWSPDGKKLAFVTRGKSDGILSGTTRDDLAIYDFATKRTYKIPTVNDDGISPSRSSDRTPVSWSPDSSKIVFLERSGISIYDLTDGAKHSILVTDYVLSFAWSPDSDEILFVEGDSTIKIADSLGRVTRTIDAHEIGVRVRLPGTQDELSPVWANWGRSGKELFLLTYGGTSYAYVYELTNGSGILRNIHQGELRTPHMTIQISPNRTSILGKQYYDRQYPKEAYLFAFDFAGQKRDFHVPEWMEESLSVTEYSWAPDGERVVGTVVYKDLVVLGLDGTAVYLPVKGSIAAWNPIPVEQ